MRACTILILTLFAATSFADTDTNARAIMLMRLALHNQRDKPNLDAIPDIEFKIDPKALSPKRIEVAEGNHTCPSCGTGQWLVQHQRENGWHSHVCGNCHVEFWHRDPQPRRVQQSDCPD